MKHTPGPWKITRYTNYEGFSICSEADPKFGCIAERWEDIDNEDRNDTRQANARLIAAAPDLLTALEVCRIHLEGDSPIGYDTLGMVKKAIAKATNA